IFGANMGFRTALLRQYPFNPALGRVGLGMLGGDESDVINRMRASGHHGIWVGTAKVRHYLPANRLGFEYLWNFWYGYGRTQCRLNPLPLAKEWWGFPRWAVARYC